MKNKKFKKHDKADDLFVVGLFIGLGIGLLTGIEGDILKKYKKSKEIEEKDRFYVEKMLNTGLMTSKDGKIAKTSKLGLNAIL